MLKTFLKDPSGKIWLNSLRRSVFSGLVVPSEANIVAKVPLAASATSPGVSAPIILEGPQDSFMQCFTLHGGQGLRRVGSGTISSAAAVVTGVNTNFLVEVQVGDTIVTNGQTATVASIASATSLTLTGAPGTPYAAEAYAILTPIVADVRDRMTVTIRDLRHNRQLMNKDVPVLHVFGDQQKQLFMKHNADLEFNQSLMFQFSNYNTTSRGSFCLASQGRKWQNEAMQRDYVAQFLGRLRQKDIYAYPYWLTLDSTLQLAASGTGTRFLTNTGELLLILFNVYGHFITAGVAGFPTEGATIQLRDQRTGMKLSNFPLTYNTLCGTSQNPFRFPTPHYLYPKTQIRADFENLVTDDTTDCFLTFHGVGVFLNQSGVTSQAIEAETRRVYERTVSDMVRVNG